MNFADVERFAFDLDLDAFYLDNGRIKIVDTTGYSDFNNTYSDVAEAMADLDAFWASNHDMEQDRILEEQERWDHCETDEAYGDYGYDDYEDEGLYYGE